MTPCPASRYNPSQKDERGIWDMVTVGRIYSTQEPVIAQFLSQRASVLNVRSGVTSTSMFIGPGRSAVMAGTTRSGRTRQGKPLSMGPPTIFEKQIQTEILAHTFKPYRYISSERNPNRCELWYSGSPPAVRAEKSPGTYLSYESSVKAHFGYWDKKDLGGIQKKEVKAWLKTLSMRKNSLRTIRNRFHSFLSWIAEETDIIKTIPHFPKIEGRDEKEKFAITLDQQFAAADKLTPVMRRAVLVMMLTAMRPSEALVLKRSDIDFEKSEVRIRRTWSGREIRETTKTGEPRTIPLPQDSPGDRQGGPR